MFSPCFPFVRQASKELKAAEAMAEATASMSGRERAVHVDGLRKANGR